MKISVIIPAYNVLPYLSECIESVMGQSYQDWEAVIVDDGSTDGTGEACDKWAKQDPRIRVFHQANSGVSSARNHALKELRGDAVMFLDADDLLKSCAFEKVAALFSESSADAVFFGHDRIDENGKIIQQRPGSNAILTRVKSADATLCTGNRGYLGVLWNKAFRTECIRKNGKAVQFDPRYKIGEDQIWLLKAIANTSKTVCCADKLYEYRIRPQSAVHGSDIRKLVNEIQARSEMIQLVSNLFPEEKKAAYVKFRHCLNKMGIKLIKNKKLKQLGIIKKYGKRYFKVYMKAAEISLKDKIISLGLQMVYLFFKENDFGGSDKKCI